MLSWTILRRLAVCAVALASTVVPSIAGEIAPGVTIRERPYDAPINELPYFGFLPKTDAMREAEMRGFAASPSPEIDNADLSGLALDIARWGAKSPADLRWLNPPREAPWRAAQTALHAGGALTVSGEISPLGKRIGEQIGRAHV